MSAVLLFSARADARRRTPSPAPGNRDGYRSAWSRCWRGRASPGPRADPARTAARGSRKNAAACADAPKAQSWRFAQARSRACTIPGAMRLPRAPTNNARSCGWADERARLEPVAQGFACAAAHRHGARLAALAGHGDFRLLEIQPAIVRVESDELRQPQARGIEQFEHGAVPYCFRRRLRRIRPRGFEQLLRLLHRQRLGQVARRFRRAHALHRIGGKSTMAREPVIEAAPRRQRQRKRAPGQARGVQAPRRTCGFAPLRHPPAPPFPST